MIQMYSSGPMRDKKLLGEAQQMLADSKAKIEYIKMRRLKAKQSQTENGLDAEGKPKGEMLHFMFFIQLQFRVGVFIFIFK